MVGGWDKSPDPDNDYASRPPSSRDKLWFAVFAAIVVTVLGILSWFIQ